MPMHHRKLIIIALLCLGMRTHAATEMPVDFADVQALPAEAKSQRYAYGDHPSQYGELWLPVDSDNIRPPLVILIHGGCWLVDYTLDHIRPLAAALYKQGYAVWTPEYRRVGEPGGGWPGTFTDIASAIDELPRISADRLDLSRTAIVGHSAGGHLALWAAARPGFGPKNPYYRATAFKVAGVVGLAAITDLEAYAKGENSCQQVTARLLGGSVGSVPERYAAVSPNSLPPSPRVLLIHGQHDTIVPLSQASALAHAHRVQVPGAGHFDLIHPDTAAFPTLLEVLEDLLAP